MYKQTAFFFCYAPLIIDICCLLEITQKHNFNNISDYRQFYKPRALLLAVRHNMFVHSPTSNVYKTYQTK